jgi:hypothetical protein
MGGMVALGRRIATSKVPEALGRGLDKGALRHEIARLRIINAHLVGVVGSWRLKGRASYV